MPTQKKARVVKRAAPKRTRDVDDVQSSSDEEVKKVAKIIKKKRTQAEHVDSQKFEENARQLNNTISEKAEMSLEIHQTKMNDLYTRIANAVRAEDESKEERAFQELVVRSFEPQIKSLSTAIISLETSDEERIWRGAVQGLHNQVESRPEQLKDTAKAITLEAQNSCRLHLQNLKLQSDAKNFQRQYASLIEQTL
ncbi:hypothetical protein CROQUDRAFT_661154 [Cronartium quercuum f. sp. fusiforme G11]|uniref:Uncharacterized protein n=1 Tax=Cronartium quercuum f. sp. fusiforme G11 TaxID=708437 RepID=A0A9P6T9F9_9BASI|nr:hypothetical protein CROQUDRAFT_661154 [Cronartium quercuum f. sp. fusiforme G11]